MRLLVVQYRLLVRSFWKIDFSPKMTSSLQKWRLYLVGGGGSPQPVAYSDHLLTWPHVQLRISLTRSISLPSYAQTSTYVLNRTLAFVQFWSVLAVLQRIQFTVFLLTSHNFFLPALCREKPHKLRKGKGKIEIKTQDDVTKWSRF